MSPKAQKLKKSTSRHRRLAWIAGFGLLAFAFSGLLHPIMSWTGPKAVKFYPPQSTVSADQIAAIPTVLKQNGIDEAKIVKMIPSAKGMLLQVTETEDAPRRYFDLKAQEELSDYDIKQAAWVARYYTGLQDAEIKEITRQTEFSNDYPWVNRLLPVYRINFDTEDQRTAYIHTETNALASLSNDRKKIFQTVFRWLHTWSWLDDAETARVLIMLFILSSCLVIAWFGIRLIWLLPKRKIPKASRRWHRRFATVLVIPLGAFLVSGIYHLIQSAYGENLRGMRLSSAMSLTSLSGTTGWVSEYVGKPLNAVSLTLGPQEQLLFRLSFPADKQGKKITTNQRFDGKPSEKNSVIIDAVTGQKLVLTDKDLAVHLGEKVMGLSPELITDTQLITRFGMHYDFRNKRLPVWQIDYDTEKGDKLFIDPATGILVDRLVDTQRYEGYSFSFAHKWNFLRPLVGREIRDAWISLLMIGVMLLAVAGLILRTRARSKSGLQTTRENSPKEIGDPQESAA